MRKLSFWKVATGLAVLSLSSSLMAQVGSLSEGACWYEFSKDEMRVASFNDKSVYHGNRAQIEVSLEGLLNHPKITDMDLALHCGGYGASLVARVGTENGAFCVWARFDKGTLVARSIGSLAEKTVAGQLCDGHKSGEFILGVNSKDFLGELQGPKWSGVIKEVVPISEKVYKILLMNEYANKESEIASQLEENFSGKDYIRYIEFNEYRHPVGEYVPLK